MGYMVELNTLLGLPKDFDTSILETSKRFKVTKPRERAFPLHIAILVVDKEWNFYGYCVVHSAEVKEETTTLTFEMLSIFSKDQQEIYKENFMTAAKLTGEIK